MQRLAEKTFRFETASSRPMSGYRLITVIAALTLLATMCTVSLMGVAALYLLRALAKIDNLITYNHAWMGRVITVLRGYISFNPGRRIYSILNRFIVICTIVIAFLAINFISSILYKAELGLPDISMLNIWITWSALSVLSLMAVAFLVNNIHLSVAALKQASARHHMIEIRSDHRALTVNKEVKRV